MSQLAFDALSQPAVPSYSSPQLPFQGTVPVQHSPLGSTRFTMPGMTSLNQFGSRIPGITAENTFLKGGGLQSMGRLGRLGVRAGIGIGGNMLGSRLRSGADDSAAGRARGAAGTGLQAGSTVMGFAGGNPAALPLAGAAALGTGLAHAVTGKSIFDIGSAGAGGPGFAPETEAEFQAQLKATGLSREDRQDIIDSVNLIGKETKWENPEEIFGTALQSAQVQVQNEEMMARDLRMQAATQNILSQINGANMALAQEAFDRAAEIAPNLPEEYAAGYMDRAARHLAVTARQQNSYASQALIDPAFQARVQEAQMQAEIDSQIQREIMTAVAREDARLTGGNLPTLTPTQ